MKLISIFKNQKIINNVANFVNEEQMSVMDIKYFVISTEDE